MVRAAVVAALFLGALVSAGVVPNTEVADVPVPTIPQVTIDGVTFEATMPTILTFTGISLSNNFDTVDKSIVLTNGAFEADLKHYITRGSVLGLDISGAGTIDLKLGGNIVNTVSYKSTSAESFCPVENTFNVDIVTHTASVAITGMKDPSVAAIIEAYVSENAADLGSQISGLIMSSYGADINKYAYAMINSICNF